MHLYHATDRRTLDAIRTHGLLVAKADRAAKIKAVWLHRPSLSPWAVIHTIRKHHARLEDVVVLEITVPRGWLTRFRTGFWFCRRDIPPARIGQAIAGVTFGASVSE